MTQWLGQADYEASAHAAAWMCYASTMSHTCFTHTLPVILPVHELSLQVFGFKTNQISVKLERGTPSQNFANSTQPIGNLRGSVCA